MSNPSEHAVEAGSGAEAPAPVSLLVARIGERVVALPDTDVERILRMAELTPLPDAPPGVVGVLNVHGAVLPVVDPRPRLGLPSPAVHPDQHLVLVAAPSRYLLWVDQVERVVVGQPEALPGADGARVQRVVRVDDAVIPLLALDAVASEVGVAAAAEPVL